MTSANVGPGAPAAENGGARHDTPAPPQARTFVPTPLSSGPAPLPPVSLLTRLLDLPAFVLASSFLYWSVALGVLMGYIRPWAGKKRRDDALGWCVFFV
jgi:hypothetical protein